MMKRNWMHRLGASAAAAALVLSLAGCRAEQSGGPADVEPVQLTVTGDIALIGPSLISLKGGMGGTYVKSLGREGQGTLTLSAPGAPDVIIDFQVSLA